MKKIGTKQATALPLHKKIATGKKVSKPKNK